MNPAYFNALNLKPNEKAVLEALMRLKYPKSVASIAREAGIPRTTTEYILHKFKKRKLARQTHWIDGRTGGDTKRMYWMYNKRSMYR